MNTSKWILVAFAFMAASANAQDNDHGFKAAMEKMQADRVAFLTEKLELTVDEAQKFWPLYNEYLKQREDLIKGRREKMRKDFEPENVTDQDLDMMLSDILDQEVRLAQIKKDYFTKIRQVLPVKKVLTLHRAEQEFMNHMLNRIREGRPRGERGPGG
jgi:Spy/CpxP family protein refolding chaperone